MLNVYDSSQFRALPVFSEARKRIDAAKPKLNIIGDEICKHALHDGVGVNMLHRHFQLEPDEVLVKRTVCKENVSYIEPKMIASNQPLAPYLWRCIRNANKEWCLSPLEFVEDVGGAQRTRARALTANWEAIQDIGNALHANGLEDVIGLVLADSDLLIANGEIQLEDSDGPGRRLRVSASPASALNDSDVSEVSWFFTPEEKEDLTENFCASHCGDHCRKHCVRHCTAHCKSHK